MSISEIVQTRINDLIDKFTRLDDVRQGKVLGYTESQFSRHGDGRYLERIFDGQKVKAK